MTPSISVNPPAAGANRLPHEQRVVDECLELFSKLGKLRAFIAGPVFRNIPESERIRLERQQMYMNLYLMVLSERIGAFPVLPPEGGSTK